MNLQTLLEYLDLEEPSQFEYFENLADLTEADEEIMPEAVCPLFEGVTWRYSVICWKIILKICSVLCRKMKWSCIRFWTL